MYTHIRMYVHKMYDVCMYVCVFFRRAVYTSMVAGRYDVGGLESYLECCRLYKPPIAT